MVRAPKSHMNRSICFLQKESRRPASAREIEVSRRRYECAYMDDDIVVQGVEFATCGNVGWALGKLRHMLPIATL
jgi:hypothetical protein